jgi:hypothetical protein
MLGQDAETRRNRPATIIIAVVALLVVISAIATFSKIGAELDNMNTYSGAALHARQVLNDIEKISTADLKESTKYNAADNAARLQLQIDALQKDVYDLNHNKLMSSDSKARDMYTAISLSADKFIENGNALIVELQKLANDESSYTINRLDKEDLKNKTNALVSYLEQKAVE